jgi:peptidoglycan/xylan/chitin deacetylase (PgdA/CDA1 family)
MFERQVVYLKKHCRVVSLNELVDAIDNNTHLPPRAVVLTFDDGWRDNYEYAFPILRQYGLPATIFLSTGYIGTDRIFWPERLLAALSAMKDGSQDGDKAKPEGLPDGLSRQIDRWVDGPRKFDHDRATEIVEEMKLMPSSIREEVVAEFSRRVGRNTPPTESRIMLNWDEVRTMQSAGICFGSHGVTHELFTHLSSESLADELRLSAEKIEKETGIRPTHLAYPNGNYTSEIVEAVKLAGYRSAVTVELGLACAKDNRYRLPRVNVHQNVSTGPSGGFSRARFACHIDGVFG